MNEKTISIMKTVSSKTFPATQLELQFEGWRQLPLLLVYKEDKEDNDG